MSARQGMLRLGRPTNGVMAGLVPAIHVFISRHLDARATSAFTRVFRRAMRGHDEQSDSI
jgi:hypothetical protein